MNETRHAGATAINPLPLSEDQLGLIDAYWRAANYLSVGQIYLLNNPLLREPLRPEHVKPRLLGHWGTTPGLNLIYAHLNRVIRNRDANVDLRHRARSRRSGMVANAYLEGTYSEVYTDIEEDAEGLRNCSGSSLFPAVSRVMSPHRRRDPSMRAANSVIRWCMPTVRHWTILIWCRLRRR